MQPLRCMLFGLVIVAILEINVGVHEAGPIMSLGTTALAQSQNETVVSRFSRWTRARLQAAKKHWAQHEQWFSECNRELENLKKSDRRISYDGQAHFLQTCMRRKH